MVQRGLDGYFVYRIKDKGVEVVPVRVPYQDSEQNIIEGVQAGDLLVSGSIVEVLGSPKPTEQAVAVEPKP